MTLPKNTVQYNNCSLQELRKFVIDRKIPYKYTHAQNHTRKSQTKREKDEKRRLVGVLRRSDAAATFRLMDLPLELREQAYGYFLKDITDGETMTKSMVHERLDLISSLFSREAGAVFKRRTYETVPESILPKYPGTNTRNYENVEFYRELCARQIPYNEFVESWSGYA